MAYKLSCTLTGHSSDVRSLSVGSDGTIISGSRDQTSIVWEREKNIYKPQQTLYGHINYVSSVCILPPTAKHPNGLLLTGSHDSTIRVYQPCDSNPIKIIEGHDGAVSHLSPADEGRFLSSSWDKTVKLWSALSDGCTVTFKGHTLAVWCSVFVPEGLIVTGCADKSIRVYKCDGQFLRTLLGHKDCIRDLCYLKDGLLLSCANDASIKRWDVNKGVCLETMFGHPNYIYSLSCSSDGNLIVSGGEDRCVRIWTPIKTEYLTIPAQSVWAVAVLPNKDIVVGSSDGIIRVFTCDKSRMASDDVISSYEEEITKSNLANMNEVGGIKINEFPDKDSLKQPGNADGQIKMIREHDQIVCYKWSVKILRWEKVGNVLGASGGTPQNSGKILHDGKEYDYVFNIDLEDSKPPIKLPYNATEDPWMVAQNFIQQHGLNSSFLSQIANFIISNSSARVTEVTDSNNILVDPFTGGTRHIPHNPAVIPEPADKTDSQLFPQTKYVRFDQTNVDLIRKKLLEFNQRVQLIECKETHRYKSYTTTVLEHVVQLTELNSIPHSDAVCTLRELLLWPYDLVFPVLDIARLAVRNPDVNTSLCSGASGIFLMTFLCEILLLTSHPMTNKMLALKLLSNLFCSSTGEELCIKRTAYMLQILIKIANKDKTKSYQIAIATLLLNYSVAHVCRCNHEELELCRQTAYQVVITLNDDEAMLRGLVALGTLLYPLEKPDVPKYIFEFLNNNLKTKQHEKIQLCCNQIVDMIQRRTKIKH